LIREKAKVASMGIQLRNSGERSGVKVIGWCVEIDGLLFGGMEWRDVEDWPAEEFVVILRR